MTIVTSSMSTLHRVYPEPVTTTLTVGDVLTIRRFVDRPNETVTVVDVYLDSVTLRDTDGDTTTHSIRYALFLASLAR